MIIEVFVVLAYILLGAFAGAACSVVAWALFRASIALWRLPGDRRRMAAANLRHGSGWAVVSETIGKLVTEDEKLRDWYAAGKITATELEMLAEFVVWKGRQLPGTAEEATAILWADFERQLAPPKPADAASAKPRVQLEGTAAVPDLPPHYFDGRVSADRPEDPFGWVEWARPGKASIWIRRSL